MKHKMWLLVIIILICSNISSAQELSPARSKEVNKAISNFESAINSQSKNNITQAELEISKMGKDATPGLAKVFRNKSKDKVTRAKAMELAVKLKDENAAPVLINVLEDKNDDPYPRDAALTNIARLNNELKKEGKAVDKKYMKNLEQIIDDSSENIKLREGALGVYGQIGQNDALPVLIQKLDDSNKNIVTNAVYGIGAVKTPEGEEALLQGYLKQKGTFVESTYVHLFGRHKMKKAVPYLTQRLTEIKGKTVDIAAARGSYVKTLGEIGDSSAIPILKEIANNPDIRFSSLSVAEDAAIALAKMGDYETIKQVIKRIEVDAKMGVGTAKSLRGAYKKITGQEFHY